MLQAALDLAALGYPVFPCQPGKKTPATLHGVTDATADVDHVEAWWTGNPAANVGMSTAGLIVIDVDGSDNPWLAGDPEKLLELATAPMSMTPSGGRHYIFRQPAGRAFRNTAGKIAEKVDTRADGGYILVAPSQVDGKRYGWAAGNALDVSRDRLPVPPDWLLSLLEQSASSMSVRLSTPGDANPIPGGQRNSTLASLGGTMRRAGMSQGEILAALRQTNASRCHPPLPDSEVETIAGSVARYEPDQTTVAVTESHFEQDAEQIAEANGIVDPGPFPDRLLDVPGFIGDVARHSVETAFCPQPVLALAGALPLLGTLTGRKVADPYGTRTNIYTLGVCESGGGKERARQVSKRILFEAGLKNLIGPEDFASHVGIINAVEAQPSILFQLDEIGRMLKTVGDRSAPHLFHVPTVLMRMFTSSGDVYHAPAYADRAKNKEIIQPNACLYGTTVPRSLLESLTGENVTDGLLSRMLIFESTDNDPDPRDPLQQQMPCGLVDVARFWGDYRPIGNLSAQYPEPTVVAYTPAAIVVMSQLQERVRIEKRAAGSIYSTLWTRTVEKARKLALLWACSEDHVSPTVSQSAAEWGTAVSVHLTQRMIFLASGWIAENRQESETKRVLRAIRDAGANGISKSSLIRSTQWLSRRDRDEILATLADSCSIAIEHSPTAGRPRLAYRSSEHSRRLLEAAGH